MSARAASWLAWSLCALSLTLTALSLLFLALSWTREGVELFDYWFENTMLAITTSPVGAVVASRRPDHPMGWLFCAIGFIALRVILVPSTPLTLLWRNREHYPGEQ